MIGLARWCITRRRMVIAVWVVAAALAMGLSSAIGPQYANNFTLPGTQAQQVLDLLSTHFRAQSGDVDTIVFHDAAGIGSPAVRSAVAGLLARVRGMPHVVGLVSPYSPAGAIEVSRDGRTAFATLYYSRRANELPDRTGQPVLRALGSVHVPGLSLAAGGQVMENAEGFNIGPATAVGAVAALVILLVTFGSLLAAGMPLVTAGLGLLTGVGLIGLATHVTDMANVAPQLALMVGLGVGVDYALFIVTRFRENHERLGDVNEAVLQAMDTSGRAILLAGTTVVIALLGMFATGVTFMYGMAVASVLAVLFTMLASLTVLPALLVGIGPRLVRPGPLARRRAATGRAPRPSAWRRWSRMVQARPWPLAAVALAVMVAFLIPMLSMRLQSADAGNDPPATSTQRAFAMLAAGFGPGFNGPLAVVVELPAGGGPAPAVSAVRSALVRTPDVVAVTPARLSPTGRLAVVEAYPGSAPQAQATTTLVQRLRSRVLPAVDRRVGATSLVGGFTAGSIDFSRVIAAKLPLFIGIVVVLSTLLLLVIFRSLVIPVQAGVMNLLSIGGALGATTAVFQWGWLAGPLGLARGPVEPWVPVLMFAVVFGLSMDYEVFLISRVHEEWVRRRDASAAVADGISFTGRVISAAAAIMVCVFLSFLLGDERTIKEFGFGLAAAVFLDALVVRCVLLPAVLELLGPATWRLPAWLDARLPRIRIEGSAAGGEPGEERAPTPPEPEPVGS